MKHSELSLARAVWAYIVGILSTTLRILFRSGTDWARRETNRRYLPTKVSSLARPWTSLLAGDMLLDELVSAAQPSVVWSQRLHHGAFFDCSIVQTSSRQPYLHG